MSPSAKEKIIVAVDVPSRDEALRLIKPLAPEGCFFKIGLQLFTADGPSIIREIQALGARIFLDLKFHDIPNTAREAVRSAVRLGVDMTTIHLSGGPDMIKASLEAAEGSSTLVLGVTVLTSMDNEALEKIGLRRTAGDQVLLLAKMGLEHGIQAIVASPHELGTLRRTFGPGLLIVVPGVRPAFSAANDQRRIMTPADAVRQGADYLVIGRPITHAPCPTEAFLRIADEMQTVI